MASPSKFESVAMIEGSPLGLGNGLLMLLRESLDLLPAGAVIGVRTDDPTVAHDLPAWCRLMAHEYLSSEKTDAGPIYYLRKGHIGVPPTPVAKPDWGIRLPLRQ